MAATVSSVWAKPGAWALDSEEHEDELKQDFPAHKAHHLPDPPATDFPSLSAATSTKPKKKNKGQTLSLAEFSNFSSNPKPGSSEPNRLTPDELLMLPTGPRQRTAEELDRNRLGGGFRNYGGGMGDSSRVRVSDRNREGGYNGNSTRDRDLGPSRADEVDDWSKMKKFGSFNSGLGSGSDRREKVGFFNSSRADEVDNWASGKSFAPPPSLEGGPRRERRMGFESYSNGSGPDSDNWSRKKEERAVDSDTWGRRKDDGNGNDNGIRRPRLNLQPRTLPVASNGQDPTPPSEGAKAKGANPFGQARPREEVLAEKGKDWKEIDEKLEALKVKEVNGGEKGEGFGKRRGFGMGRSESAVESVRTWRKPESNDVVPPSNASAEAVEAEESVEVTEETDNGDNCLGEK